MSDLSAQIIQEILRDKLGDLDICYYDHSLSINQNPPEIKTCTNLHSISIRFVDPTWGIAFNKRLTQKRFEKLTESRSPPSKSRPQQLSDSDCLRLSRIYDDSIPIFHLQHMELAINKIKEIDDTDGDCYDLFLLCDQLYGTSSI